MITSSTPSHPTNYVSTRLLCYYIRLYHTMPYTMSYTKIYQITCYIPCLIPHHTTYHTLPYHIPCTTPLYHIPRHPAAIHSSMLSHPTTSVSTRILCYIISYCTISYRKPCHILGPHYAKYHACSPFIYAISSDNFLSPYSADIDIRRHNLTSLDVRL